MARYKEYLIVETDEPDLKVQKLNASASGADKPAGIVPLANIPRAGDSPSERSRCSVFKQENCQL